MDAPKPQWSKDPYAPYIGWSMYNSGTRRRGKRGVEIENNSLKKNKRKLLPQPSQMNSLVCTAVPHYALELYQTSTLQ